MKRNFAKRMALVLSFTMALNFCLPILTGGVNHIASAYYVENATQLDNKDDEKVKASYDWEMGTLKFLVDSKDDAKIGVWLKDSITYRIYSKETKEIFVKLYEKLKAEAGANPSREVMIAQCVEITKALKENGEEVKKGLIKQPSELENKSDAYVRVKYKFEMDVLYRNFVENKYGNVSLYLDGKEIMKDYTEKEIENFYNMYKDLEKKAGANPSREVMIAQCVEITKALLENGKEINNVVLINGFGMTDKGRSGEGRYEKGEKVTIYSYDKTKGSFDRWTTQDDIEFEDMYSQTTTFIMPDANKVVVTPNYYQNTTPITNLSSTTDTMIMVKPTTDVQLKIEPANTTERLKYKSSNKNVATVVDGKITAKSKGETTITVYAENGQEIKIKVIVKEEALKKEGTTDTDKPINNGTSSSSSSSGSTSGGGGGGSTSNTSKKQEDKKADKKAEEKTKEQAKTENKTETKTTSNQNNIIKTFTDVKEGHWASNSIANAVSKGYFVGTSQNTFSSNMPLTRGQFVTVLGRLAGINNIGTKTGFKDVKTNAYYAKYVNWAVQNGLVKGYENDTFNPNGKITREEMSVVLAKYLKDKKVETKVKTNFKDNAKISSWAKESIDKVVSLGILKGRADGTFGAKDTLTRAEMAQILMVLENL